MQKAVGSCPDHVSTEQRCAAKPVISNECSPTQGSRYLQIGPIALGPFPPEEGKGRCAVSQFPAPLWGKDVTQ